MVNLLGMFRQLKDIPALWRTSKIELVSVRGTSFGRVHHIVFTDNYIFKWIIFIQISLFKHFSQYISCFFGWNYFLLLIISDMFSSGDLAGFLFCISSSGSGLWSGGCHGLCHTHSYLQNTMVKHRVVLLWDQMIAKLSLKTLFCLSIGNLYIELK